MYRSGLLGLEPEQMGIYAGSTLHEVAHAVGAGNAMGPQVEPIAVIVKMIRVMLLVPVLLVLGYWVAVKAAKSQTATGNRKVAIPWFAVGFLAVICLNSLIPFPKGVLDAIQYFDTFLLTMAMAALGAETSIDKFKKAGAKPFVLAFILWIWLLGGGYLMARYLAPIWL